MKREGAWEVKPLPIHGYQILDSDGREVVRDVYRKEDAEQIVREHNAVVFAVQHGHGWELSDWQNWRSYHARHRLIARKDHQNEPHRCDKGGDACANKNYLGHKGRSAYPRPAND